MPRGSTVAGPVVSGALQFGAGLAGLRGGMRSLTAAPPSPVWRGGVAAETTAPAAAVGPELSASGAARSAPFEPEDIPGRPGVKIDTEPLEGGLPDAASNQRAAILRRVGVDQARESARQGDAKRAATDFQL